MAGLPWFLRRVNKLKSKFEMYLPPLSDPPTKKSENQWEKDKEKDREEEKDTETKRDSDSDREWERLVFFIHHLFLLFKCANFIRCAFNDIYISWYLEKLHKWPDRTTYLDQHQMCPERNVSCRLFNQEWSLNNLVLHIY